MTTHGTGLATIRVSASANSAVTDVFVVTVSEQTATVGWVINTYMLNVRNSPNGNVVGSVRILGQVEIDRASACGNWWRLTNGNYVHQDFVTLTRPVELDKYVRPVRVTVLPVTGSARHFGANRNNGARAHAGIDLMPANQDPAYIRRTRPNVYAVADGVVISYSYFFAGTHALVVEKNDGRQVRYAEITSTLRRGDIVSQGDIIGHITPLNTRSQQSMLHLEYYMGTATGALSQTNSRTFDYVPVRNWQRRRDLLDPTFFAGLP